MHCTTILARTALAALALACAPAAQSDQAGAGSGQSAAKPAPKPSRSLPAAPPEQVAAADRALKGTYDCDFNQKLAIANRGSDRGYLDVTVGRNRYTMKPMVTSTGALRMEDVTGRMLLLQIANKSMLMDTKLGQRVADNCVHPTQR